MIHSFINLILSHHTMAYNSYTIERSTKDVETTKMKITYEKNKTLNIIGFSRAGDKTSILIEELNLIFDYGLSLKNSHSIDNILISHGHYDHIGALQGHHCGRRLNKNEKQKLYVMPKRCVHNFKVLATAVSNLNTGRESFLGPFENFTLTKFVNCEDCKNIRMFNKSGKESDYTITTYPMTHKISAFGYIVSQVSKKLKDEYRNFDGKALKLIPDDIKTYEQYTPIIGYTGDTTIEGVLAEEHFLTVPVLFIECTFFENGTIGDAKHGHHIHFNDIVANLDKFKNTYIVLFHISQMYRNYEELQRFIDVIEHPNKDKLILFY